MPSAGDDDTIDGVASPNSLQQRYQVVMSKLPEVDSDSVSQTTTIAAAPASPLLAADVDQGRDICKVSIFF